ncbi:MAG: AI-2E family transporter [Patescibacteria group bacterium]
MEVNKFRNYTLVISLVTVSVLLLYVLRPFFYPLFWAAVLASLFYPVYKRVSLLLRPNAGALLTLLIITLIVILPLSLIVTVLVRELVGIFSYLNSFQGQLGALLQSINRSLHSIPYLASININDALISQQINDVGKSIIEFLYESIKTVTQNSLEFFALFVLMLYSTFFFLRDGDRMLKRIMFILPLGKKYEQLLYEKFLSTAGSTIKSTILLGGLQGILGGLLFLLTGVPSPLIWGIAMAVLAAIPVTGTFLVWFPTGVFMIFTGQVWQGVVILLFGLLVISTVDNLLRPLIVGKDLQMHPVIVLFSTLGGLVAFGLSGFVIGPLIAALCQTLWNLYEEYYHAELSKN